MSDCQVLFSGEIVKGCEAEQVQSNLAAELGVSPAKAKQLFSGRTVVLRSQLNETQAHDLQQRLADLGAVVRVKNLAPVDANPARYKLDQQGADRTLRDLTAAHRECPRCGHMQLDATHCARCGVDIEAALKQQRKEDAIIEKKLRELRASQEQNSQAANKTAVQPPIRTDTAPEPEKSGPIGKMGRWFKKRSA